VISDDLSALFAPGVQGLTQAFAVCLGQVLTFDPNSGSNTVAVPGGGVVPNVPLLNYSPGATRQGDSVLLGRIGNGYVIIGSIITPGSNRFGSGVDAVFWDAPSATGWTSSGDKVTETSTAPSWAQSFMVFQVGSVTVQTANPGAAGVLSIGVAGSFIQPNGSVGTWGSPQSAVSVPANGQYGNATQSIATGGEITPGSVVSMRTNVGNVPPTLTGSSSVASMSWMIQWFAKEF
jgi:hypothetical protein